MAHGVRLTDNLCVVNEILFSNVCRIQGVVCYSLTTVTHPTFEYTSLFVRVRQDYRKKNEVAYRRRLSLGDNAILTTRQTYMLSETE
jgi:hypothetical protein